jgi:hypothetical protein
MNRRAFWVVVLALAVFVGYIMVVGNRLPAAVLAQIQAEQQQLIEAKHKVADERGIVAADAAGAPELFRVRAYDQEWPARFTEAGVALSDADRYAARLEELRKRNQRSSRAEVDDLLQRERERRDAALSEAAGVVQEARKRIDLKQNFPQTLARIESGAKPLETADYSAVTAKIQKAEQDWPSKKDDLQKRLDALLQSKKDAVQWEQTAKTLEAKPATQLTADDYAKALDAEESEEHALGTAQALQLSDLSHQLYTSWDNVLEDLDKNPFRERIQHVVTTVSAPADKGATTSQQYWIDVSRDQYQVVENDLGMTIAHKPLGVYDSEADRTPEPAGFAYMASPEQGRNQYGYWEHNDGGSFWHWLPEYLILRDLLSHHSYMPIPSYDWGRYQEARRYGQTYYGRDESGLPKFGSHGTFTQQHYGGSHYAQSGGFSGSKYASGGGSRPSMGVPDPGHRFGSSGSSPSGGKKFGGSSFGKSFGRSAGRSFGGRRH